MAVPGNAFVFNKLVKFSVYMVLCPLAVLLLLMKVILPCNCYCSCFICSDWCNKWKYHKYYFVIVFFLFYIVPLLL